MDALPLSERLLEAETFVAGVEDFAPAARALSRAGAWLTNGHWCVHLPAAPRSLHELAARRRQSAVSPSALAPALAAGRETLEAPELRLAGVVRASCCGGESVAVLERVGARRGAVQVAAAYAMYFLRAGLTLRGSVQGEPVGAWRGRELVGVVGSVLPGSKGFEPVSLADLERARTRKPRAPVAAAELSAVPQAAVAWARDVLPTLQLERHELREAWLTAAVAQFRHWFAALGSPLPDALRVSCSWPKDRRSTSVVGQCAYGPGWRDGIDQLSISPALDEPKRVLDVLLHELVHAACGMTCSHGKGFRRLAVACGLTGQMTATVASPELVVVLEQLVARHLGAYPHAGPKGFSRTGEPAPPGAPPPPGWPRKQGSRMRLYECKACGQKLRAATDELEAVHVPDRGRFELRKPVARARAAASGDVRVDPPYGVTWGPRSDKALARVPPKVEAAIRRAVEALATEPRPPGYAALRDVGPKAHRIWVGRDYRVGYDIDDATRTITVWYAGPKKGAEW